MGSFWETFYDRVQRRRNGGDATMKDRLQELVRRVGVEDEDLVWPAPTGSVAILEDADADGETELVASDDCGRHQEDAGRDGGLSPEPPQHGVIASGENAKFLMETAAAKDHVSMVEAIRLRSRATTILGNVSDVRWTYGDHLRYALNFRDYLEAGLRASDLRYAQVLMTYEDLRDRFRFVPSDLTVGADRVGVVMLASLGFKLTWQRLLEDYGVTPKVYLLRLKLRPLEMVSLGATADVLMAPDNATHTSLWGERTHRPTVADLASYVAVHGLDPVVEYLGLNYRHLRSLGGRSPAKTLWKTVSREYNAPADVLCHLGYTPDVHRSNPCFSVREWDDARGVRLGRERRPHRRDISHGDNAVYIIEDDEDDR